MSHSSSKLLRISATLLCLLALPASAERETYGAELTTTESIRIGELVAHPERYVDRTVRIDGLVDDVCPMKGCWVDIVAKQSSDIIRFKVEDDVIVFPVTAKGSQIVAEGVLRKHEMSEQRALDWMRHLAEEKGEPFDPKSVTGPMVFYQIEGAGAVVTPGG